MSPVPVDAAGGAPRGEVRQAPTVSVVRGRPDETELAALVAGLVALDTTEDRLASGADDGTGPGGGAPTSAWTDRARGLGRTRPGPDAWRWSLRH